MLTCRWQLGGAWIKLEHGWRLVSGCVAAAFLLSVGALASTDGVAAPLSASEFDAVIAEIKRMVATPEHEADRFVVREATPERIERLYGMPELLAQPRKIRENGLIFAGKGELLSFDKPSDVITKVSRWFPGEVARAREKSIHPFYGTLHLFGPFPSWDDEPAAFMGLWNCVPQSLWVRPESDPFSLRSGTSNLAHFPITARDSDHAQADFGGCIRQRNANRTNWKDGEKAAVERSMAETGARIAEVIQRKFDRLLQNQGCQGRGPDDCVQVLRLWISLEPSDARLARQVQRLEPEVAIDGPLPALQGPTEQPDWPRREGEPRFDALARHAAFLRIKIESILAAPRAWPEAALPAALRQATRLQQRFFDEMGERQYRPDVNYASALLHPIWALDEQVAAPGHVRDAVLAELHRIEVDEPGCKVQRQWLDGLGPGLESGLVLERRAQGRRDGCARLDWAWLKEGRTAEAIAWRTRFIDTIVSTAPGLERDAVLSFFTNDGQDCFRGASVAPAAWQAALCNQWVHELADTPLRLARSQLELSPGRSFHKTSFQAPRDATGRLSESSQMNWLATVSRGLSPAARTAVQAQGLALQQRLVTIDIAELWRHPGHSRMLLRLHLRGNEGTDLYLALGPHTAQAFGVPTRFTRSGDRQDLARVSDLDEDGQLELWFADGLDECQGDEGDLRRTLDCHALPGLHARMGEVSGDALSYFVNDLPRRPMPGPDERWRSRPRVAPPPLRSQAPCNQVLLAQFMAEPLGLDFDQIIGRLVCKPHPVNAGLTVVAFFHELENEPEVNGESRKGFVMAVVDARRAKVLRVYRDTIEEDASIRVDGGGLSLDTARYLLAPGVRALGVRMHISHSPRYAEGGEGNYLTLVVEEGRRLRPILLRRAMRHWRMIDTACWNDAEGDCVIEERVTSIALGASSTGGWRDLALIETISVQEPGGVKVIQRKAGALRARGGWYR